MDPNPIHQNKTVDPNPCTKTTYESTQRTHPELHLLHGRQRGLHILELHKGVRLPGGLLRLHDAHCAEVGCVEMDELVGGGMLG